MRVALVHDWLTGMRGGEKCLEGALEVFPDAEIFTLIHRPGSVSKRIESRPIHTSFLQRIPGIARHYRYALPLFPMAVERFDLSEFDLVLSLSHAVAKGAIPGPGGEHACYCFSPMRYVWDRYGDYFTRGSARELAISAVATRLRTWDVAATARVDRIAAISRWVERRIERYWRREATIVHPPVEDRYFEAPLATGKGGYLLVVSALVPYKRIEQAIEASRRTGQELRIVGDGPEAARLRARAPASVRFLGWRSDDELVDVYRGARALLFPGVEDFGIVPVECQAVGRPVIGLGAGGLLETVVGEGGAETPTGVLYDEPTVDGLSRAIERFGEAEGSFDPGALRAHAAAFRRERFLEGLRAFALGDRNGAGRC